MRLYCESIMLASQILEMFQQKYCQYIDSELAAVKKSESEGWTNPFGYGL